MTPVRISSTFAKYAAGLEALLIALPSPAAAAACPAPDGYYVTPGSTRGVTRLGHGKENGAEYVRIGGDRFFVDGLLREMPDSTTAYEAKCQGGSLKVEMNIDGHVRKLVLDPVGAEGELQVTLSEGDASMKVAYKPYAKYVQTMSHEAKSCPRYNRRYVTQGGDNDGLGVTVASVPATTGMLFTINDHEFKVNGKPQQVGDMKYVADCVDKNIFIKMFDKTNMLFTSLRYQPQADGHIKVTEIDRSFTESQYQLRTDIAEKPEVHSDYSEEEDE